MRETPFSYSEILSLETEPDVAVLNRQKIIQSGLSMLITDPNMTWEVFQQQQPLLNQLDSSAISMLERSGRSFVTARKASFFWEERYRQDASIVEQQVRSRYPFPADMQIKHVGFSNLCCVVSMPYYDVHRAFDVIAEQEGREVPKFFFSIRGFADPGLFLESENGIKCPIIVIPSINYSLEKQILQKEIEETQAVVKHEEGHVFTQLEYFQRSLVVKSKHESQEDVVINTIKKFSPDLSNDRVVEHQILSRTEAITNSAFRLYYNEMLSEAWVNTYQPQKFPYGVMFNFDHLNTWHLYAKDIEIGSRELIQALSKTNIGPEKKILIWDRLEQVLSRFFMRIYLVDDWLQENWMNSDNQVGELLSRMYAVSTIAPWKLGVFINKDTNNLRGEFENPDDSLTRFRTLVGIKGRDLHLIADPIFHEYQEEIKKRF